ncbi:MAG: peptidoglycan DD-metalloendopeptidase family protein [Bacteroidales bacterium]|nr:peptidoglycan DD-metalloendopeptidase family protein [Bacteroidales bacterium]
MRNLPHKILLCLTLALALGFGLRAQDVGGKRDEVAKLEKEIAILDAQIKENSAKSKNVLANINLIRKKVANRQELIKESDRQIRDCENKIQTTQNEIQTLQSEFDTLSVYYARLIKAVYKNRDTRTWYMYIFASKGLGQAFRRYVYFRNMSSMMNRQAEEIRSLQAELDASRRELQRLLAEAEAIRGQRQKEVNTLTAEEKEYQKTSQELTRNRTKYQNELDAKRKQVEALNNEIKKMLAEAMKEAKGGKAAEIDYKLADEFAANKGRLPWPAAGPVVDKFGQHYHPVFTKLKLPFNNGVGIALSPGTEVKAVFNGVVKQIVVMPGYNQCVLVQHGNYFTFYCKLKNTTVKAGDNVRTGQVLGTVDTINGETQLHFQVWQGQTPQNPETWLRQ